MAILRDPGRDLLFACDEEGCRETWASGVVPRRAGAIAVARAVGYAIRAAAALGWTRVFPVATDNDDARGIRKALPPVDRCPACSEVSSDGQ